MSWYRGFRMVPKIVLSVGFMLVVALGLLSWQIQSRSAFAMRAAAERELAALAGQNGNAVKSIFEAALDAAKSMADGLSYSLPQGTAPDREELMSILRGIQLGNTAFLGTGCAWEANAYDGADAAHSDVPGNDASGRFMPYLPAGLTMELLKDLDVSAYYTAPKERKRPFLTDPFEYQVGNDTLMVLTASAPVLVNDSFRGIVFADLELAKVADIVENIHIFNTGRGAVLTQDSFIVAHPDPAMVGKNLVETGRVTDGKALLEAMKNGKPYTEVYASSGVDNIYYYHPIHFESTGQTWYFGVAAPLHEVLAEADSISMLTMLISGVTLALALLVLFFVTRSSLKPLGILAASAQKIADGNLEVSIDDKTFGGEMLDLSSSLKAMIASLLGLLSKAEAMSDDAKAQTLKAQEAVREAEKARLAAESAKREGMVQAAQQLEDVVGIISSASEQLAAQVEQSERGSSEQAARVSETAAAMEEMNATVMEVARSAGAASELSSETRGKAESGAAIVRQALREIRNVQEVSLRLKDDMSTLSGQAESISAIMNVISDIADQTNLLALNAAIEAARAGEAGRGFAVVADEVRKLAEKTMSSTKDVGDAIASVQTSVRQSIEQVDKAAGLIEEATEDAGKSGAALDEIVTMVDDVADQVRSIATASEEQSATSEEINRSVNEVNDIATQTAQTMREAAQAVSSLAAQAHALSALIDDMKKT